MTEFQNILRTLNSLIEYQPPKSMSDADFIANIDAINVLYNLHADLNLQRTHIRIHLANLYPELLRRIHSYSDPQLALPLIKAHYRFIYDRDDTQGPRQWQETLAQICRQVIESYRRKPLIHPTDYLFALHVVCCATRGKDTTLLQEYSLAVESLLDGIDTVPLPEKIRRIRAYERAKHLYRSPNHPRWTHLTASLLLTSSLSSPHTDHTEEVISDFTNSIADEGITADSATEGITIEELSQIDDEVFIQWREITDLAPMQELERRSRRSHQMQVEYQQSLIFTTFLLHPTLPTALP